MSNDDEQKPSKAAQKFADADGISVHSTPETRLREAEAELEETEEELQSALQRENVQGQQS